MTVTIMLPGREGESTVNCGPCSCGGVVFHVTTWNEVVTPAEVDEETGEVVVPQVTRREGRIVCETCVRARNGELVVGLLDASTGEFSPIQPTLRTSYEQVSASRQPASPGDHEPAAIGEPFPGCPLDRDDPTERWGVYVPDPRDQEYYRRKAAETKSKEEKKQKAELRRRLKAAGKGGLVESGGPLLGDPDKQITKKSKRG